MSSEHTRTGVRRSGDDYQDVIAIDVMVEMLEHPDRYQWVQVEADDFAALDDVVALRTDGSYIVRQVKFAIYPEEETLDWEYLLEQGKGRNDKPLKSLLQKWSSSLDSISTDNQIHEASLLTNRKASTEIQALLSPEGILDFGKLNGTDIYQTVNEQIGGEDKAKVFFANFHFYLDQPDITTYEKLVRKRFHSRGGSSEGWLNLKDTLRHWVRLRNEPQPEGLINLDHIKKAAAWNQLKQMPQNFKVPADYILPNKSFYEQFKQNVISGQQDCFVCKPRCWKKYISQLSL